MRIDTRRLDEVCKAIGLETSTPVAGHHDAAPLLPQQLPKALAENLKKAMEETGDYGAVHIGQSTTMLPDAEGGPWVSANYHEDGHATHKIDFHHQLYEREGRLLVINLLTISEDKKTGDERRLIISLAKRDRDWRVVNVRAPGLGDRHLADAIKQNPLTRFGETRRMARRTLPLVRRALELTAA